jgi:antirestriction protein ArdC
MNSDVYKKVSDEILANLRKGVAPWVKPWSTMGGSGAGARDRGFPHNVASNRDYNGGNVIILLMAAAARSYPTGAWATYKQIAARGGQVRKGERSTVIVWLDRVRVKDKTSADPDKTKVIPMLRTFNVFNAAQADWVKDPFVRRDDEPADATTAFPECNATVAATGATIKHGGSQAFYAPAPDFIQMPVRKSFKQPQDYFATLFHELTHWTGHESRNARPLDGRFGDSSYAFEELVAELGAAFLCAKHGIDCTLRHSEYIGHWIRAMTDHDDAFFRAASLAQKAADFVLSASEEEVEEEAA